MLVFTASSRVELN